jgi:hypothetical protein
VHLMGVGNRDGGYWLAQIYNFMGCPSEGGWLRLGAVSNK